MVRSVSRGFLSGVLLTVFCGAGEVSAQTDCIAQAEIPAAECEALLTLWQGASGPSWDVNFGWAATNSPCTWFGVSCASGHVEELVLRANNLTGGIPTSLGDLAELRVLDLRFNQMTGPIPPELGTLSQLVFLLLEANSLTGTIPQELGSLSQLELLYLADNQLGGGIPKQLEALLRLAELRLGGNRLEGTIPPELGNIGAGLSTLSLRENLLEGPIPAELAFLVELTALDLAENDLDGELPRELGSMVRLVEVDLSGNQLSGEVPLEILGLTEIAAGGFAIPFNCLTSSDVAVRGFLDFASPGWEASQCVRILDDGFERGDLSRWTGSFETEVFSGE